MSVLSICITLAVRDKLNGVSYHYKIMTKNKEFVKFDNVDILWPSA